MEFELMAPMEQAATMAALALIIIALTYMADRMYWWSCMFVDRRARGRREREAKQTVKRTALDARLDQLASVRREKE